MRHEHLLQIERAYTRLLRNTYVLFGVVYLTDHAPTDFVPCVQALWDNLFRLRAVIEEVRHDDDGAV